MSLKQLNKEMHSSGKRTPGANSITAKDADPKALHHALRQMYAAHALLLVAGDCSMVDPGMRNRLRDMAGKLRFQMTLVELGMEGILRDEEDDG